MLPSAQQGELKRIIMKEMDTLALASASATFRVSMDREGRTKLEGILTSATTNPARIPFLVSPTAARKQTMLSTSTPSRVSSRDWLRRVLPQYRGSTGYGSDFLEAIYQHFGDRAYSDVDSATDFAVAQAGADPDRLAILAGRAGGFMTSGPSRKRIVQSGN